MSSALDPAARRKADLESKKLKLLNMRKAREDRAAVLASAVPSRTGSPSITTRADVDELMASLDASGNGADSRGRGESPARASEEGASGLGRSETSRSVSVGGEISRTMSEVAIGGMGDSEITISNAPPSQPNMVSFSTSTSNDLLPTRTIVTYDKSIQTTPSLFPPPPSTGTSTSTDDPNSIAGGVGRENSDEMRARIIAELEEERIKLDAEIEVEKRSAQIENEALIKAGLSAPLLSSVLSSPPFLDFLESSSKIVQRALGDSYDYLRDYSIGTAEEGEGETNGAKVRLLGAWYDETWGKGRSVTGVNWSPKFPELLVASYNKNPMAVNEPNGIACVWNLHLRERPEFVFHSQSEVFSVSFSAFHPNIIIGGTYSGQILLWDTRSRHPNPVLKTPLSASGHTHPVYSLSMIGTQNAHNLISASTDGTICGWTLDMLARPQETLELLHPNHNKTDEVSVTALGFPESETRTFWVGTEEGNVYSANRYDRAGAKAGLVQNQVWKGHSGPVTSLDFHPGSGTIDLSDLFLTSGVDWTVKLWRTGGNGTGANSAGGKTSSGSNSTASATGTSAMQVNTGINPPIASFDEADDYVYDVKWHPNHPAMFASVDGAGKFDVWNLNLDTEVPIVSTQVAPSSVRGLNKLAWDKKEGKRASIGSSDGKVYIYELSSELLTTRENEWELMRKTCNSLAMGGNQG